MTTATKRTRTRAVPRPAPSPLPTLEDYGLKARAELPGESWVKCWQQERAYTMGFRCGRDGGPAALLERWYDDGDYRRGYWVLGVNDGTRVRERNERSRSINLDELRIATSAACKTLTASDAHNYDREVAGQILAASTKKPGDSWPDEAGRRAAK